jgi:hypothetical protein
MFLSGLETTLNYFKSRFSVNKGKYGDNCLVKIAAASDERCTK